MGESVEALSYNKLRKLQPGKLNLTSYGYRYLTYHYSFIGVTHNDWGDICTLHFCANKITYTVQEKLARTHWLQDLLCQLNLELMKPSHMLSCGWARILPCPQETCIYIKA